MRVYNSLSKQKELFEPVRPGKIGMYLCGPTVYKSPHVGHMVGPIIFDAIKRYLVYKGFEVTWIVNITDVDDKLIEAAAEQNMTVQALAEKHTHEYFDCLAAPGIDTIDRFPKASEHMEQIVTLVQKLIDTGYAYEAGGSVYFDVAKDADYGKLSHRDVNDAEAGTRDIADTGKRSALDFALWKAAKPGEPEWDSPWGNGRPGWHIECSAMSMKYLGESFDIHGGGLDLMFPHHENELAQSESATGKPFARFWLHNGLTRLNTKKISGSDAKTAEGRAALAAVAARKLIEALSPELLRYLLLSTHYRSPIDFSEDVVGASRKGLAVFPRLLERVERMTGQLIPEKGPDMDQASVTLLETDIAPFARSVLALKMNFLEMMDDDFNTAGAIAVLHELAGVINAFIEQNHVERDRQPDMLAAAAAGTATLRNLGLTLGLFRQRAAASDPKGAALLHQLMQLFIQLRHSARKEKNFALADSIRKGLAEIGVTIEDRPDGTTWRRE